MTSQEYYAISRAQRAAYFAWQTAPAGEGNAALAAYEAASKTHPERRNKTMTTIRETMRREGYKAHKVLAQDPNGGAPLISAWIVVKSDTAPRPGEMMGGYRTRDEAWHAAEGHYEFTNRR